ncbi:unnamed protein product [Diamesa hyperborea]
MKLLFVLLLLVAIGFAHGALGSQLVINKLFQNIGSLDYRIDGKNHTRTYFVSREIKLFWAQALMFCQSFGMELVSLPLKEVADQFTQLCADNAKYFDKYTYVGGTYIGAGLNDWYWISDGKPATYHIPMQPGEPNNFGGKENCLSLDNHEGVFKFNDINGFDRDAKFVCEIHGATVTTGIERSDNETSNHEDSTISNDNSTSRTNFDSEVFDDDEETQDYEEVPSVESRDGSVSPENHGATITSGMESSDDENSNHEDSTISNDNSTSSITSTMDLFDDGEETQEYEAETQEYDEETQDYEEVSSVESRDGSERRRQRQRTSPYQGTPCTTQCEQSQTRRSQGESPITCPICLENVRNRSPVSTNCGHIFCRSCLHQALQEVKKCPLCKKNTSMRQFHDIYI